jgi:hypothetical protein
MVTWVGAGLAGLIGLLTSDLTDGAPAWLEGVVATLIVVGIGVLAWARIKFEWCATQLGRALEDGERAAPEHTRIADAANPDDVLPESLRPWPRFAEVCWILGLLCVPAAGIVYLVAVWLAVD